MPFVVSANRLDDGSVVYLTQADTWSVNVDDARVIAEKDVDHVQRIGLDAEARDEVVASYTVEIDDGDTVTPTRLRERIRSHGPTVGDQQSRIASGPEG